MIVDLPENISPKDIKELRKHIRDIPDFPKKGINFKDITPLLGDAKAFALAIDTLSKLASQAKAEKIVGIDARGFIFAAPVARQLGAGFVPVRKLGKLPSKTVKIAYQLEYGEAEIEMHVDAIEKGQRVVIIDDLLATGGTALAAAELVRKKGGDVRLVACLIELEFLKGRQNLLDYPTHCLVKYA